MKKFAKISLAAAVAVAGLSSVASAKPLEEAIKGVDATGYVTYQYNDVNNNLKNNDQTNQSNIYKAAITLTVPAADDVSVKVTGVARGVTGDNKTGTLDGDANPTTNIAHANFTYTGVQNLTVIAGKQALNTPWTEGSSVINSTQSGTGVLALYNAGFATIAAGHFMNNGIDGTSNDAMSGVVSDAMGNMLNGNLGNNDGSTFKSLTHTTAKSTAKPLGYVTSLNNAIDVNTNDISVAAIIAPIADVATAQVWYANIGDKAGSTFDEGGKAWSFNVNANLMDIAKLDVRHSTLKINNDGLDLGKQKLTKAVLSGAAGPVNMAAGYAKTADEGGIVAFDKDADAAFTGYQLSVNGIPDAKAYLLTANMNVLPSVNVGLTHIAGKGLDSELKFKETYAQVTYTHNKNLSAYVRYGTAKVELDEVFNTKVGDIMDSKAGRLQVGYKF